MGKLNFTEPLGTFLLTPNGLMRQLNPLVPKHRIHYQKTLILYSIQVLALGSQIENRVWICVEVKVCKD